jgi:hypothetical protein
LDEIYAGSTATGRYSHVGDNIITTHRTEAGSDAEPETKMRDAEPETKKPGETKKRDAETKKRDAETKKRDAETKKRDAETKKRDAETKKRDAETKKRDAETKKRAVEPQTKKRKSSVTPPPSPKKRKPSTSPRSSGKKATSAEESSDESDSDTEGGAARGRNKGKKKSRSSGLQIAYAIEEVADVSREVDTRIERAFKLFEKQYGKKLSKEEMRTGYRLLGSENESRMFLALPSGERRDDWVETNIVDAAWKE